MDSGENSYSDSDMGVDETSDTPMEVNNTQDSSVERTRRGAVQCKRITKMREGELLNVQYNEDGQRIGEGGKDLASYSGQAGTDPFGAVRNGLHSFRPDGPKRKRVFVKVVEALVDVEGMVVLK
ncbi:hypothetical protein IFM89_006773 [Coptis chinensis]|uniref:Uncharacterized protein n=1 Tax=Coptis chinensis TaxID=261450 RepID=A0A835I9V1_9MAGN|nr:hypothetical protein IFM89_006773 [Coptis chinensis]